MLRINVKPPPKGAISANGLRVARAQKRAAHNAVDRATREAKKRIGHSMKAKGLGRLDRAIGHNSSKTKGKADNLFAWGAVFAKDGPDSLSAGALESYAFGSHIRPRNTQYLWFQTNALQRRVGVGGGRTKRLTPALYNRSHLVRTVGPLVFKRTKGGAILFVRDVTLSPKNGRAKAAGKRKSRTRIPAKLVVLFIGIRWTRRAKRFDHLDIMRRASDVVPRYIQQDMEQLLSRGRQIG